MRSLRVCQGLSCIGCRLPTLLRVWLEQRLLMQGSSAAVVNRSLVDGVQSNAQAPLKSWQFSFIHKNASKGVRETRLTKV